MLKQSLEEYLVPVPEAQLVSHLEAFQARLCVELSVPASLLYIADATQNNLYKFEVGAGLAHLPSPDVFRTGEGFFGQAVLEKRPLTERLAGSALGNPAASALVDIPEVQIHAIPLIYQEQVEGLWCVAADKDILSILSESYWEDLLYKWAAYLQSIRSRRYIQALLEQSQVQNQELITREEELRQNLEELAVTQEEMRRAQQLLAHQSERQNFIIDLFTIMAPALTTNFASLSRIFLAQTVQYFHAEAGALLSMEGQVWRPLFFWRSKKSDTDFPSIWHIPTSITEALNQTRQPACYSGGDLGIPADKHYWLLLPYYTTQGVGGLLALAFEAPYPLETENHKDLLHIPIAYFTAYERTQRAVSSVENLLNLIAQVSNGQLSTLPTDTPAESLPWLTEIPLVQRETYLAAFREAVEAGQPFWIPPEEISQKELIVLSDRVLHRLKWQ